MSRREQRFGGGSEVPAAGVEERSDEAPAAGAAPADAGQPATTSSPVGAGGVSSQVPLNERRPTT